jgi:hypothetical protein
MGIACPYPSPYQTQRWKAENIEDITWAFTSIYTGRCARIDARIEALKMATKITEGLTTTHTVAIRPYRRSYRSTSMPTSRFETLTQSNKDRYWQNPPISLPVSHDDHDIQSPRQGKHQNVFISLIFSSSKPSNLLQGFTSICFWFDSSHLNDLRYISSTFPHLFWSNPCFISCHYQSRPSSSVKQF